MKPLLALQNNLTKLDAIPKEARILQFAIALVISRSVLLILVQGVLAYIFQLQNNLSPWESAAAWWTIYGTMVDIGCLVLIALFLKRENKRISDLLDFDRNKIKSDAKNGILIFLVLFPLIGLLYPIGVGSLIFNDNTLNVISGQLAERILPSWAYFYSVFIWWIIWSITEELTYQAYSLPRLLKQVGKTRAVLFIAFFWALQHSFLPFIFDWRYVTWRFLSFLPLVIVFIMIYMRTGRLTPIIIAHGLMDLMAALWTFK